MKKNPEEISLKDEFYQVQDKILVMIINISY